VLRRTLQLEAGNGPAERKEWAMSTHAIGTKRRFRPAAVRIVLASALALSALTAEARSVWSGSGRVTRPATVRIDPYASKGDIPRYWLRSANGITPVDRPSMRELLAKKSGR
jgi:hypothetical protein